MNTNPRKLKVMWDGAVTVIMSVLLLEFCPSEESVFNGQDGIFQTRQFVVVCPVSLSLYV